MLPARSDVEQSGISGINTMQFKAECTASMSKNGATYVLLRFEPNGHLMGEVSKELGELKSGKTYRITIEEED